jgi:hypothetical protein
MIIEQWRDGCEIHNGIRVIIHHPLSIPLQGRKKKGARPRNPSSLGSLLVPAGAHSKLQEVMFWRVYSKKKKELGSSYGLFFLPSLFFFLSFGLGLSWSPTRGNGDGGWRLQTAYESNSEDAGGQKKVLEREGASTVDGT